jgi:hypothetical protein
MDAFGSVNDCLRESSRSFRWLARKLLSRARQRTAESPERSSGAALGRQPHFARLGDLPLCPDSNRLADMRDRQFSGIFCLIHRNK